VIRLLCAGRSRLLGVRESPAGLEVVVDGAPHALAVRQIAPGSFVLERDGRAEVFHCVRDGDDVHLFWKGVAYPLRLEREGARRAQRQADAGLEAPMPGRVTKLSVTLGQRVRRGDEILVVEAMKMENALRAPRDGRVVSLRVQVGDMVSPGVVLAELV
jgi:acetyl/propionyl-CoA carboxylase alpha subunit